MTGLQRLLTPLGLLVLVLMACDSTVFEQPPGTPGGLKVERATVEPRVIILVVDGPRYSEAFGDSSHRYVDQIWSRLRPQGVVCTNFRNLGATITVSGHAAMLTGVWQTLDNGGLERPDNPTIFEYFRKATGAPQGDAVLVGGKLKLSACAYSDNAEYGSDFAATVDLGYANDFDTFDRLMEILQNNRPRLVMVSFSRVDQLAHSGVWEDYLNQISVVDSLAALTWDWVQSDSLYADNTYMFISADHGRHDDLHGGFQDHGDTCEGCQRLVFLALGPGVLAGAEVTSLYTQRDLCTTVGSVLGVETPLSGGGVIDEIFEPAPSGIAE